MGKKAEQICPTSSYYRRGPYDTYCKKQVARETRREAKKDPENAPKKRRYRGYAS